MNLRRLAICAALASALSTVSDGSAADVPARKNTREKWVLTMNGLGPVRIGMSVAEASRALGHNLEPEHLDADEQRCFYGREVADPPLKNIGFMIRDGRLARVDVLQGSDVKTAEGAGIGTTEARLMTLYPDARSEPHHYTNGHYVVVRRGKRALLFETEGGVVWMFRSGRPDAVALVEGCS